MAIVRRRPVCVIISFVTVVVWPLLGWAGVDESRQGHVLTVQGQAFVGRAGTARPQLVSFQGQVREYDVIETQLSSRVKVLLPHDILVTIGENSRVELTQFSNGKSQGAVLNCERGMIRLNVGQPAAGTATQVIVHIPTGRIVSQGAYFIVWAGERVAQIGSVIHALPASSGAFNLGPEGTIVLAVEGASVAVMPGQVAIVDPEQHPRIVPQSRLPSLTAVVEATELKDVPNEKPAREVLTSLAPLISVLFTPPAVISGAALAPSAPHGAAPTIATAAVVGSVTPSPVPVMSPSASASSVVSPVSNVVPAPAATTPTAAATVPAAISNASQLLNSLLGNGSGRNGNGNGGGRRSGR